MIDQTHHSIADWDFSNANWILSMERYTSAPTSFNADDFPMPTILCNHPSTLCIPEGRILCQCYFSPDTTLLGQFFFRNQCPTDQVPNIANCYLLYIYSNRTRFREMLNNEKVWEHTIYYDLPRGIWVQLEITWWNYPPYDSKHPLAIQLRAYYYHAWHDYGRVEREIARWHDSPINRIGFRPLYPYCYFDDFEIHAPVWPPPEAKLIYTSILSSSWPSDPFNTWVEWDLSALIPAEATAVEVSLSATDANTAGCRPFGSTLSRIFALGAPPSKNSYTLQCEVGADRKIETMRSLASAVDFRIIGYWIPQ